MSDGDTAHIVAQKLKEEEMVMHVKKKKKIKDSEARKSHGST